MKGDKYGFVIVGSGAGGATLAMELAKRGKQVLIVERGKHEEKIGTFRDSLRYFDGNKLTKRPAKAKEGAILWRTMMAGGTTVVSCGNGVRCLEEDLVGFGINLDAEFVEAEGEMKIVPYDERRLSRGSKKILEASKELGYRMEPMPKFIDPAKCRRCGGCQLGCKHNAKWTALNYLDEAKRNGAEIVYNTRVQKVVVENGKVKGVSGTRPGGSFEILADVVILAAGGVGTPVILQRSGVEDAGSGFFMDLLVNTYGVTKDLSQTNEPTMALVDHEFHKSKGFILSPFLNQPRLLRYLELGVKGIFLPTNRLLGIMTKIADDPVGRVYPDGTFSKPVTERDRARLKEGSSISKEILVKAGADRSSIVVSKVQGGHPGGTAAIGKVVDKDLQTKIDNLFVCDASVFPTSPGLPPILTIVALAKRLSKTLAP
jgi:choline dehydrogenase-like flavoprotein